MTTPSPWADHLKIAIQCWARNRARELADKTIKVEPHRMEYFLAEVLTDALLTFNADYMKAYNEQLERMERLLHDAQTFKTEQSKIGQ